MTTTTTTTSQNKYMLMMRGSHAAWQSLSPSERQRIMETFYAYVQRLKEAGRFQGGSALSVRSRALSPSKTGVQVIDGPFAEAKEALNGYFIITASSLDEAVEIGHGCPCLAHGESVEIIEMSKD